MSIESDWRAIETQLNERSPQILADLLPPITDTEVVKWSAAAGVLPTQLHELYRVHAGTATRGDSGFSFIGEWWPLPVDYAIDRYDFCRRMAESYGRAPLIPFAVDFSGDYLAVRPGGNGALSIIIDDSGDVPYGTYQDIATLVTQTVEGLRGNTVDYRAELTDHSLSWTNLEEEADDLAR